MIYIVKNCLKTSTKGEKVVSIILFSLLFFVLIFVMCFAILKNNLTFADIPMLSLTKLVNPHLVYLIIAVIILAILSTFMGVCVDLNATIKEKTKLKNDFIVNSILFSFCLLLSNLGLNTLINYGYKFTAYFSLIYFTVIFIKYLYQKNHYNPKG